MGRASRERRQRNYDETRRRGPKRQCMVSRGYMERGAQRGEKRCAIVVGPAVVSRAAAGQYEWRDAGHKRPRARWNRR